MMSTEILDLFEPKMPPINLWCITPASWFYRTRPITDVTYTHNSHVHNSDMLRVLHELIKDR